MCDRKLRYANPFLLKLAMCAHVFSLQKTLILFQIQMTIFLGILFMYKVHVFLRIYELYYVFVGRKLEILKFFHSILKEGNVSTSHPN